MLGQYLRQLENINLFQAGTSLFFFLLFSMIVFMIIKGNKKVYDGFGDIPLETENQTNFSQDKIE